MLQYLDVAMFKYCNAKMLQCKDVAILRCYNV